MSGLSRELAELERIDPTVAKAAKDYDRMRDVILSKAHPFCKMAGGKTQLLPELVKHVPERFGTYFEPFLGGGALFWHLVSSGRISGAWLSDRNEILIRTWRAIRDDVDALVLRLSVLANDPDVFRRMRERDSEPMTDLETAEWFLYLNKTAFNGLYRVNKRGRFNVPFGDYPKPRICDEANLRACSEILNAKVTDGVGLNSGVTILAQPFEDVLLIAKQGDLIYLDPPYAPLSKTSSFVSYTKESFSWADQERVRDVALELKKRGAFVIVSNSDQPRVRELYADPRFTIHGVKARRNVNSVGTGRGPVGEVIVT